MPMELNADGAVFSGLKVGRRSIDIVLVGFQGIVRSKISRMHDHSNSDEVVHFAHDSIHNPIERIQDG